MPTTSNFGWTTPADTDLVKDGASAIRTLGNNIDSSMAQLKGGTTGQVLSKTNGTDMAFTWVTQDDANAIQNTIVDAKGDLITATGNDVPARLAVGNNGDTLVADSAATTGLRWQGTPSASNPIINSAMDVWQRGTSFAANYAYTADRWQAGRSGGTLNVTVSRQTTSDTTNLPFIQYCARVQRDSGVTTTNTNHFGQNFETVNSIPFVGKTVTLSFYARAGANFSSASSTMTATLANGTGTDQNYLTGQYTNANTVASYNATLTTTWQRFSFNGTVPTNATELAIQFSNVPVGTAGAADYFEITGVQLDIGSVALPFRRAGGTIQGELAACQRYYWRSTPGTAYGAYGACGFARSTSVTKIPIPYPVQMRVIPTSVEYSSLAVNDGVNITAVTSVALSGYESQLVAYPEFTIGSTVLTQYRPYHVNNNNNTAGYLGFNAEL
jgi:hypothetical protein